MIYLIFYSLVLICTKIAAENSFRGDFNLRVYNVCEVILIVQHH